MLAVLAAYAQRGRFPRNENVARRTPIFIDAHETRCAMAHLIEQSGDRALVERVASTKNFAYVRQLASDLALRTWLAEWGLTAQEAARIQPAYCFITKGDSCLCQGVEGSAGVVEGTVTEGPAMQYQSRVMVEALHGDTGGIVVGQTIDASGNVNVGDSVLVNVQLDAMGRPNYWSAVRLESGYVDLQCQLEVPAISKADAIAAMLAPTCSEYLESQDSIWGESQCDSNEGGGGCSAGGAASPAIALFAAALWMRRR